MPQNPHGRLYDSILDTVGGTPMVRIRRMIPPEHAAVYAKCEFLNPGSSVKDRIAVAMLEEAQATCGVDKDCVIIEPTSGNTGIALTLACAAKGYRLMLIMPDGVSIERRRMLKHLGVELILTPADRGMKGAVAEAQRLAETIDKSFQPRQFSNPAAVAFHRRTTAEEIWQDTDGKVDIFVAGVGTGATLTGVAEVIKARKPEFKAIAVEPAKLPAIRKQREGHKAEPGNHKIQGIGAGFVPENLNMAVVDEVIAVEDDDAFAFARRLAQEEGIPAGISSGANIWAAAQLAARPENAGKLIVTVFCSAAERYLSTPLFETPPGEPATL